MKNILFLTAYAEHSKEIFKYALTLANQFGCKITFASYVSNANDEKAIKYLMHWGKAFSASIDVVNVCGKHQLERAKYKQKELKEIFANGTNQSPIGFQIKEGETTKVVQEYHAFTQADLLVLATHQIGFWSKLLEPSIISQTAKETLIPLLVLKQ